MTLLMACSPKTVEPIVIPKTQTVQLPAPIVPSVSPLHLRPVKWVVITSNNYSQIFNTPDLVFFSLTTKDYENLSLNQNDLRTHIQQQQSIILLYKRYFQK